MSLFFVGDKGILDDKKLSSNDKIVYLKLVSYMNRDTGSCYPRQATIGKAINLSRATVYRSITRLAKLGYIKITRKSSTNEYYLRRQLSLENARKKHIKDNYASKSSNYASQVQGINKTIYNYSKFNNRNFYNKSFSSPPIADHSKSILRYQGKELKYTGTEDHYIKYKDKDGNIYQKHKFKNVPIEKINP